MGGLRRIIIGQEDHLWQHRFAAHVRAVFDDVDFSNWIANRFWPEHYHVLAIVDGEEIVSTVGRTAMTFVWEDGEASGYQLGAVATASNSRGRGHARRLMEAVIRDADRQGKPLLLFANETVTDFYPRFGFTPLPSCRPSIARPLEPGPGGFTPFDTTDPAHVALIRQLAALSPAHAGLLSARPDPTTALWYLCSGLADAFVAPQGRSILVTSRKGDRLTLLEWFGAPPLDLGTALRAVLSAPIQTVEFGFMPPASWALSALQAEPDADANLFWRGPPPGKGHLCFPQMLRT